MSLSLIVSDNADGTGGVLTIAGSDSGSSNSVYSAPFAGGTGPLTWSLVGTRTGDGTIATALQGFYAWNLTATVASAPAFASYFRALTNAAEQSVMDRALSAVVQQLQTLSLSGIESTSIVRIWKPRKLGPSIDPVPMIQVFPADGEQFPGTLTGLDDVGYPIGIAMIDAQNRDYVANQTRNLLWRQKVSRIFRFQRLSGVNEIINTKPGRQVILSGGEFGENLFASLSFFSFISREPRGAN